MCQSRLDAGYFSATPTQQGIDYCFSVCSGMAMNPTKDQFFAGLTVPESLPIMRVIRHFQEAQA
jgi:hypothetical protein